MDSFFQELQHTLLIVLKSISRPLLHFVRQQTIVETSNFLFFSLSFKIMALYKNLGLLLVIMLVQMIPFVLQQKSIYLRRRRLNGMLHIGRSIVLATLSTLQYKPFYFKMLLKQMNLSRTMKRRRKERQETKKRGERSSGLQAPLASFTISLCTFEALLLIRTSSQSLQGERFHLIIVRDGIVGF